MNALRKRLSFSNVTAALALFVALGGTSYAAATIGAGDIRTGAVKKSHIRKAAVGKSEIRKGAVAKSEIRTNGVGKGEIRKNAVGNSELKDESITATDIGPNAVGTSEIAADAVDAAKVRDGSLALADLTDAARAAVGTVERAAVSSTGAAVGGTAESAGRVAAGTYTVTFDRDVSDCQYFAVPATVVNGTTTEEPAAGSTATVAPGSQTTQVVVETFDAADAAADTPFHLQVACG